MGRFINADAYASTGQGILGNNMFAYCLNNPICYSDHRGTAGTIDFQAESSSFDSPWSDALSGGGGIAYIFAVGGTVLVSSLFVNTLEQELARKLAKTYVKSSGKSYKTAEEIHHVVPKASHYTALSTLIVNYVVPYGVENPINKISIDTALHRHLHTNLYYGIVNASIINAFLSGQNGIQREANVSTAIIVLGALIKFLDMVIPNSGG